MGKVILYGNGAMAKAVYFSLKYDSPHETVAFTVDPPFIEKESLLGLPVIPFPKITEVYPPNKYKMLVAVGFSKLNRVRADKYYEAKEKGYELISHVSSKAIVWPDLTIGENCLVGPNSIIQPFAKIGNNVVIRDASILGHHCVIKDHSYISVHAIIAGHVSIEPYCFIGMNATLRDGITIAQDCVIGAGALILDSTREKEIYKGKTAEKLPFPSDQLRTV